MNVLVIEPKHKPYTKNIDPSLESLQHEVGGNIEAIYPYEDKVAIICNEEGKLAHLPLNRAIRDNNENVCDIIAGKFLIAGIGEEDFTDLSPEMLQKYAALFAKPEVFMHLGDDKIIVFPIE